MNSVRKRETIQLLGEAQNHRCAYCGVRMTDDRSDTGRTIDHILPRSQGGKNTMLNMVLACQRCNGLRSSMDALLFWEMVNATERQIFGRAA